MFAGANNADIAGFMVVFESVVREGGFSAAADALGVSKATVSKHIARLEAAVGARLLQRTTRVVKLTEAGEIFFDHCTEVAHLVTDAGSILSSIQEEFVGRVRISIPTSFGNSFLQAPITSFLQKFPQIQMDVHVSDEPVDVVEDGFDLAIRVGPVAQQDLIVRKLGETRKLVVCSPEFLESVGTVSSPEQLSKFPCLLYAYQSPKDRWLFRGIDEKAPLEVPVRGRVRSSSGDMLAAAARQGLGFAWLPDFIVRSSLDSGELVSLFDDQCEDVTLIRVLLPARKFLPAKVKELLQHLESALAPTAISG